MSQLIRELEAANFDTEYIGFDIEYSSLQTLPNKVGRHALVTLSQVLSHCTNARPVLLICLSAVGLALGIVINLPSVAIACIVFHHYVKRICVGEAEFPEDTTIRDFHLRIFVDRGGTQDNDDESNAQSSVSPTSQQQSEQRDSAHSNSEVLDRLSPSDSDICFGDDNHPGTKAWKEAVKSSLEHFPGTTNWGPPVYKFIRHKLQGRDYYVDDGGDWREATNNERREWFERQFEKEKGERSSRVGIGLVDQNEHSGKRDDQPETIGPGESENLTETDFSASHNDCASDSMPVALDVCFGKKGHAGTKVWMEAVKSSLEHNSHTKWKLPVYEFIRHKLPGRRFFVWSSNSGRWEEATEAEMR